MILGVYETKLPIGCYFRPTFKMKAAVYYGPGNVRVEERPDPVATDDNLIAKVEACAICGTDIKIATAGNPRCHPPRIIGHEMVGTIEHVGKNIKGFAVGERITLATTVACNACPVCDRGQQNMCPNAKPVSYDSDGAFAEYIAVPPQALAGGNVIKVPEGIPNEAAALSEPISCALNAQALAGVTEGDTVLVVGGGPLGALHAEIAKALGAAKVMVVEMAEPRLSMLRNIEDLRVIDGANEDVAAIVQEETGGLGVDRVIVCAPARAPMEQSLQYARKGGTVSLFASLPKGTADITLDSRLIHYNELRMVGASDSRPEHVQQAVDLMKTGRLALDKVVTHTVPLADFAKGIELMKTRASLKVLVIPGS